MIYYYVVMGVLPILYHYFGLNDNNSHEGKNQKSLLFTKTIFTNTGEQFENIFVGDGKLCPDDDEKKGLNEEEKSKIFKENQIIGDIKKQEEEKIQFTVKIKDDYYNS